jgi:signal transduction histidine kinase
MLTPAELLKRIPGDSEEARRAREAVEEIAREYEAEHQKVFALFDEAPMFMSFLEGPELLCTMINRVLRETTAADRMLGKKAREVYPVDNPIVAVLDRVWATGKAETVHGLPPYYADGAYGQRYFTRTYVPVRDAAGGMRGILTVGYEVTKEIRARIEHEEREKRAKAELGRLFTLLEEVPLYLSVVEPPEWRITMVNRRQREMFGRPLDGLRLADLVPADNPTLLAIQRVHASGLAESITVHSELDGYAGRAFSATLVPLRDPAGPTTRVMVASLEITEQLVARESLEEHARALEGARREAVDAGRAKDQFLAMLGHELRNPLAPMATAVDVLRIEGVHSDTLDLLERQIRHVTRLVDDLLDISRITRGKVVLQREPVDLATIVNRALEMSSPLLEQRGHRVVTDIVPGDGVVSVDPARLAQVMANLIANAAKYSEPGTQIRIVGQCCGERAKLAVSDEGVGIAPEMLDRVFEAFVQQPQTIERAHGGLGLGLAIVKNLVEAHGGTVSAHSDGPGRGSTFVVELPAIAVSGAALDNPKPATRPAAPRPAVTPLRILVVDDNFEAADILKIALEALGHTIEIAYDGPSALEAAKAHAPQIALVDIGLPVMDGYQLAALMRAAHDMPLIAITGYGQQSDRERTRTAGFAAHLVKPVDLRELGELVSKLCDR